MFTIQEKAGVLANDQDLTFGKRIQMWGIARGYIAATRYDQQFIVAKVKKHEKSNDLQTT